MSEERAMSTVYMSQQLIRFADNQLIQGYPNKLVEQGIFSFSSNVIDCSLSVIQSSLHHVSTNSLNFVDVPQLPDVEKLSCIGVGIDNIAINGVNVNFTAWMQALSISGAANTPQTVESSLSPVTSYLTVLAIAQCE